MDTAVPIHAVQLDHASASTRRQTAQSTIVSQFIRFFMVGVFNTGLDLMLLNALMLATGFVSGWAYAGMKALSFTFTAVSSYLLNRRFTFRDTDRANTTRQFSRFYFVSILGAVVNVSAAAAIVNGLQPASSGVPFDSTMWANLGALFGSAAGMFLNFAGYRGLVFRSTCK